MTDDLHKRDAVNLANSQLIDWLNEEAECEIASAGELTTLGKKLRAMEVTARRLVRDNAALLARLEAVTPSWLTSCSMCGRVVDMREQEDGGDAHGCECSNGWACSRECALAAQEGEG